MSYICFVQDTVSKICHSSSVFWVHHWDMRMEIAESSSEAEGRVRGSTRPLFVAISGWPNGAIDNLFMWLKPYTILHVAYLTCSVCYSEYARYQKTPECGLVRKIRLYSLNLHYSLEVDIRSRGLKLLLVDHSTCLHMHWVSYPPS